MKKDKYTIELKDDFLHIKYLEGSIIDLETLTEAREVALELVGEKRVYTLIDIRVKNVILTSEAMEFAAKDVQLCKMRIAEAIMFNSKGIKVLVDSYNKYYKPVTPTQSFKSEKLAIKWFEEIESKCSVSA